MGRDLRCFIVAPLVERYIVRGKPPPRLQKRAVRMGSLFYLYLGSYGKANLHSRGQFCIIMFVNSSYEQRGLSAERAVLSEKRKALVIVDDRPLCDVMATLLAKAKEGSNYAFDRRKR